MKIRVILLSLFCAVATLPSIRAQDHNKDDETELGNRMDDMSSAVRKLKKQVGDATKNEDSLKLVATIRKNAEAASKEKPAWTADQPADKQAEFVAQYQKGMKDLLALIDKLEAALKAGDNAAAQQVLGDMGKAQKAGHKQFKKPEKK